MDREGFASSMGTLADAWNKGGSRTALDLFTDDPPPMSLVRLENDKIADWREYQYPSDLDWEAFSAGNRF